MKAKELTIEEKAKAYDEALKVLHKYDGVNIMFSQSLKEEMFPELAESDDDRIRKVIADIVKAQPSDSLFNGTKEKCLAWLEKQGEQKVVKWSHKDAKYLAELWEVLSVHRSTNPKVDSLMEWVKEMVSLIRQEWSEDDKEKIESVLGWIDKQGEKKPAEWSKEDERNFDIIYGIIYNSCIAEDASRLNAWLLSLRPQKQWKPSLAQLNALSIVSKGNAPDDIEAIVSLYNDLKKLKG